MGDVSSCEPTVGRAAFARRAVSSRRMEVSDAMWEAAGEMFYKELPKDCGLPDEKYDHIVP